MNSILYLFRETSLRKAFRILRISRRPIVIGGCGRSGTSLLVSILSCHPHIFAIAEETVALCPDGYGPDGLYNRNPKMDVPLEPWRIYRYLIDHLDRGEYRRWCEKTPRNVLYFRRILEHFGRRVRLIHIVRDGRDVITSRHPTDPSGFWVSPDRWVRDVAAGREFEGHPQVLTLRYEDLLRDYEGTLRRLCDHIGEKFHPAFLDYPESARVKQSLAWFGGARKITTDSIGRWKRPEFADRIKTFMSEPGAVELLQHFGYPVEQPEGLQAPKVRSNQTGSTGWAG